MDHREKSHEYAQKFNFFWPILLLSVLSLSLKTADFQGQTFCAVVEIVAWIFLVAALIISILRIEGMSILHDIYSTIEGENGETDKRNNRLIYLYSAQRWLFILAVILIVSSRIFLVVKDSFPSAIS